MKKINHKKVLVIIAIIVVICIFVDLLFKWINKANINNAFQKYNLNIEETVAIYELEKENSVYIYITIGIIVSLTSIFLIINYYSNKKLEAKFEKILLDITKINNKNYKEVISQIEEGKIGSFQNEIYSVISRLQEYSENINKDRTKLAQYLSDISHQLRTPLLSLNVLVDNLLQNEMENKVKNEGISKDNDKNKEIILNISNQLNKMKWLVENLLKMAQLDTKVIKLKKEEINVNKLIKEVIKNVEILLELSEEEIIVTGEENIKVIGDFKWNVEAITNILKNAIEHSDKSGKIYINYEENLLYVELTIQDSGEGISEKDLIHIFDRFYKGENSNRDSFGIGLSLAKEIIEYQNGEIIVESKKNKGTKFIIKYLK